MRIPTEKSYRIIDHSVTPYHYSLDDKTRKEAGRLCHCPGSWRSVNCASYSEIRLTFSKLALETQRYGPMFYLTCISILLRTQGRVHNVRNIL